MQTGLSPSNLGTPVTADLKVTSPAAQRVQNSLSQQIFDNTMKMADIGMNEKRSIYKQGALGLQGMVLSKAPNGGFSKTGPEQIVIGASHEGIESQSRVTPTFFSGDAGRTVVGPPATTTLGNEVYRQYDGKTRDARGAMSIQRVEEEKRISDARRADTYNALLNENPVYADPNVPNYVAQKPPALNPHQLPPVSSTAPAQPLLSTANGQDFTQGQVAPLARAQTQAIAQGQVTRPLPPYVSSLAQTQSPNIVSKYKEIIGQPEKIQSAITSLSTLQTQIEQTKTDLTNTINHNVKIIIITLSVIGVVALVFFIVAMVKTAEAATYKARLDARK